MKSSNFVAYDTVKRVVWSVTVEPCTCDQVFLDKFDLLACGNHTNWQVSLTIRLFQKLASLVFEQGSLSRKTWSFEQGLSLWSQRFPSYEDRSDIKPFNSWVLIHTKVWFQFQYIWCLFIIYQHLWLKCITNTLRKLISIQQVSYPIFCTYLITHTGFYTWLYSLRRTFYVRIPRKIAFYIKFSF